MIELPQKLFLYTLDQIATMLNLTEYSLKMSYLHFEGRSVGTHDLDLMYAVNIAPNGKRPQWRVSEREFIRWLRRKGFKFKEVKR